MDQPSLTTTAYLEAIARDSGAIAAAAHEAGLDAPVPSCPGWTVGELVTHLARRAASHQPHCGTTRGLRGIPALT